MKLHKEGTATITLVTLVLLVINSLVYWLVCNIILSNILGFLSLDVLFIVIYFFRVPNRNITKDDNLIYSVCDGKVVVIEETEEPEYFKDKRIQVSVFMSPLNVHVNYHPISGVVKFFKYHAGKYLVAWHPKSSTENERTTIVLEHSSGKKILARQIAGALARRVVPYVQEGQKTVQGEELGFIKFGSRIDLFLPLDAKIQVKLGDIVTGTQSVIAKFN